MLANQKKANTAGSLMEELTVTLASWGANNVWW